jgi:hypothetical protein
MFHADRIIARQLIGKVPAVEGAYVATGHSVWGILNAPATGRPWRSSSLTASRVAPI